MAYRLYVSQRWRSWGSRPGLLAPAAFVLSALLAMMGYFLVCCYAPEAGGSGILEIEGALEDLRPVR